MPEYLAPGVFVEETSFRAKSIEGVSTSTTGFVGATRRGPLARPTGDQPATLELLTSFFDFRRLYGGFENLQFTGEARAINQTRPGRRREEESTSGPLQSTPLPHKREESAP